MRARACFVLVCAGCGPDFDPPCVEIAWSLPIDFASDPCDVETTMAGDLVLLACGIDPELIEVSGHGELGTRTGLTPHASADEHWRGIDLAVAADGTRWALIADIFDAPRPAIAHVPAQGPATITALEIPGAAQGSPQMLALEGTAVRALGTATPTSYPEAYAFLGTIESDTLALRVDHTWLGLAQPHALLPRGGGLFHAVLGEPSIDYSDAHLVAIDDDTGALIWTRTVGMTRNASSEMVSTALPLDDGGVVVARRSDDHELLAYDGDGNPTWQHTHTSTNAVSTQLAERVQDRILVVLQLQSGGGFEAEVIEADGTPVCTASIDAPAPHYRAPMAAVDDGAVLITEAEDGSLSLTKLRVVDRFEP